MMGSRFFLCQCIGLMAWFCMAEPAAAQAYGNFPFVSDFGTVSAPGADNTLYQFTNATALNEGWAMEAASGNALYPTFTENELDMYPMLVTRPFRFTAGFTYRLSFTYEADAAFPDADYCWRLAPQTSDGVYDLSFVTDETDPSAPGNKLIMVETAGVPAGEQTAGPFDFTPDATGVYALTFMFYHKEDGLFFPEGDARHLRIKSINITEKSPYDLAMGKIETPVPTYNPAPQTVSAWVRNEGSVAVESFKLCYTVGAQTRVFQTFNQRLEVNAETLVTFDNPANLSSGPNRIRVFLSDEPEGAPTDNDTTPALYVSVYDEPYTVPFSFDFGNNTLNQRWTVLYDEHTARTTWQFGQQDDKACAYINTAGTRNNARLASPGISLTGGKTYRFSFRYTGLTDADEKLAAYMVDAGFTDASRMTGYWKDEGFTNQYEHTATFFYTPATDGIYHMVLKACSDDLSGGIAVWNMEVNGYDPVHGDFYYEFDPMEAEMTAAALFNESAYLMDRNHNGQAWRISTAAAYNGDAAGRAGESFLANSSTGHTSDDWLVFNPVYLESGKTYTLSYMLRAGDNNRNVILESMFCREAFAFNASDILQTDRNEINGNTYQKVQYTFTPAVSDNYLLAFRYNTLIKQGGNAKADYFDIYIDHIGLYEVERHDFELPYVDIPVGAQMGRHDIYIKCGYRNFGNAIEASQLKFCFQINQQPVVSESAVAAVATGGIGRHNFNQTADFSRDTLNEVRVWAQKGNTVITDTFKTTVHSLRSYYPPYRDLLTETSKEEWRISSLKPNPSWLFGKDNTFDAPYAAQATAGDALSDDYLVMPAIHLQKDTVYLLAFYAKSSVEKPDPTLTGLSAVYSTAGYGVADFNRNIGQVNALTTEYKRYQFYFKALENNPAFIAFRSQLPAYSGVNWIDHVVVLDSVSASYSYMSLTDISYRRVAGCDENRTTAVEVEICNDGYLAYDSVPILYQMDKLPVQTYWLENGLADKTTRRFELPERWDLDKSGIHHLQVWIGMPNEADRADDTLSVSCRIDGMAQLPVGYDFENNVLPGTAEDRNADGITWELHRNADSAYAGRYFVRYEGTGQSADDDWQLPCFYATTDDYTLDFYMSAPYASEELVAIYLIHYDETDEYGQLVKDLLYDGMVNHADYKLYQLPFSITTGHYGILFHIKSEADGRTLCIDNLSVSGYGLRDVALLNILSPTVADEYDNPAEVTVRLRNNGRVTVHDVPVVLTVNGNEVQREEVPTLESGADINYTFSHPVDLHEPGTYRIVASVEWVLDQRPGNNRKEIVCIQSEASDLALTVLTEPMGGLKPYSDEETMAVRIENRGRSTVTDVPINAVINGTQYLNGILPAIESGRAIVYTFEQTVDMSDSAWYEFIIYLSPAIPDNNPENDTLYSRIDGRYAGGSIPNEPETPAGQLILYPNPVHTTMHITVPPGYDRLEIYALNGRRYLNRTVSGGTQLEIPADGYPEGMYILRLSGLSGEKTVKWIKVR